MALDAYRRYRFVEAGGALSSSGPEIVRLSEELNRLRAPIPGDERFRNPAGVYMKLANFLRLDREYTGVGLVRGAKRDEEVWKEFEGKTSELRRAADAIRRHLNAGPPALNEEDNTSAQEGSILLRHHLAREGSRKLRASKIRWALANLGELPCEVCDMTFEGRYGEIGAGFIEVHHRIV